MVPSLWNVCQPEERNRIMNSPARFATFGAMVPALAIVAASPALEADRIAREVEALCFRQVVAGHHPHVKFAAVRLAQDRGIEPDLVLSHNIVKGLAALEGMG